MGSLNNAHTSKFKYLWNERYFSKKRCTVFAKKERDLKVQLCHTIFSAWLNIILTNWIFNQRNGVKGMRKFIGMIKEWMWKVNYNIENTSKFLLVYLFEKQEPKIWNLAKCGVKFNHFVHVQLRTVVYFIGFGSPFSLFNIDV